MLCAFFKCAALAYHPLAVQLATWNSPGSPIGLPGGGHRRNWAHNCAQSSLTLPGDAEARSGNAGGVFRRNPAAAAALGSSMFIPGGALLLGVAGAWEPCGFAVLLPDVLRIKKPCKPKFTGCVRARGGHRWSPWPLVWPFG